MIKLLDYNIDSPAINIPDIYFSAGYHKIWEKNTDDGISKIVIFEDENLGKIYYPLMLRPCSVFKGSEEYNDVYEAISNYGYGGPILKDVAEKDKDKIIELFRAELEELFKEKNIITELTRFHSLIKNYELFQNNDLLELMRDKATIYIKIDSEDEILDNMSVSTRNQVRQSLKKDLNIEYIKNPDLEQIKEFYQIYKHNMEAVNAADYYLFNLDFFIDTFDYLKDNAELAFVYHKDELVSASIFMFYNNYVHYHLSGAKRKALDLRVNNFLLYKTARRFSKRGFKYFHLGGGLKDNDGLFNFKKGFAPDNRAEFYIGRKIHNQGLYKEIYDRRREYRDIPEGFVLPHSY
jgi:hypothetical protein